LEAILEECEKRHEDDDRNTKMVRTWMLTVHSTWMLTVHGTWMLTVHGTWMLTVHGTFIAVKHTAVYTISTYSQLTTVCICYNILFVLCIL
jgi:hypothetical protein